VSDLAHPEIGPTSRQKDSAAENSRCANHLQQPIAAAGVPQRSMSILWPRTNKPRRRKQLESEHLRVFRAEGTGLEPATACAATDFESVC